MCKTNKQTKEAERRKISETETVACFFMLQGFVYEFW